MTGDLPVYASDVKVCSACGNAKPLTDFHRHRDALRPACKACTNAQNRGIYLAHSEAHLEAKRRYRELNHSARLATVRKYDATNAQSRQAHQAVKRAVAGGLLPAVATLHCAHCGAGAAVYHHESYEPERWLDVVPLCRVCHGEAHRVHA